MITIGISLRKTAFTKNARTKTLAKLEYLKHI